MSYGLWLSAGGMQVNEYRQAVMANNLANVDTAGFKRNLSVVQERRMESESNPAMGAFSNGMLDSLTGGPWSRPTYTSFAQGGLEETGRNLDVALSGEGFLTVSDGTNTRYTRDGRMTLDIDGTLKMVAGDGRYAVLDTAGQPIVLDRTQGEPTIGLDGSISQNNEKVAQIGLTDFEDPNTLRKSGNDLFEDTGASQQTASTAQVHSGFIERSTVDSVTGLVDMIEVSRAYELNAKLLSLQDQTLGAAVTRVGRIG